MPENRGDRCFLLPAVANEQTRGLRGVNLQTGKKEKDVSGQRSWGNGENWIWRVSQRLAESDSVVYRER